MSEKAEKELTQAIIEEQVQLMQDHIQDIDFYWNGSASSYKSRLAALDCAEVLEVEMSDIREDDLRLIIKLCDMAMKSYKSEKGYYERWCDLEIRFREALGYILNKKKQQQEEISCRPRFLILMHDDNTIIKHPLIEIKDGKDMSAAVNEVIQDLIVDEDSEVYADIAHLIKAVEVQFVTNHFIHTHFSVTGF
jgi:hypothetical protein